MQEELKPCPFCGASAETHRYYPGYGRRVRVTARCTSCRCNSGEWGRIDKAIKAWNRRASDDSRKEKDMKCDKCGKEFKLGDRPDGLQNGISFLMPDGRPVALCCECLIELGKEIMEQEGE